MESFSVEMSERCTQESPRTRTKGGLITLPFIIANEAFEKVASYGILPNMVFYLMKGYGMSATKGTNLLFLWSAATNFTPIVAAFFADSYLGRFLTIALGSIFSLLGMILLWLTAMIPKTRPPPCNASTPPCAPATSSHYGVLISAFALMSVGAGGIRDMIVYIQDKCGWKVGFGVPAILMFLSAVLFLFASPFYIKRSASQSLFTGLAQVIVVAFKNRRLALPPRNSAYYHCEKGSEYTTPTDRLRFLNKACIIRNPKDVTADGVAAKPWNLSTVKQVEELKILIRVIPIWSTGIIMLLSMNASQSSFPLLQAKSMDRHLITSSFQIPAGSFGMFLMICLTSWMFIYDRGLIPLASKMRGKQVRISPKIRMGIGLFISSISLAIAGTVEHVRREKAIKQGLNNPEAVLNMSAMWLVPQYGLNGIADALNAVAQTEFYYIEFPKSMKSIGSSLIYLAFAVASLLASVILNLVDKYTKGEGKESWVSSNINKAHYDYFYWLLAILGIINLLYYMLCSWAYGPCVDASINKNAIEENQTEERSLVS